MKPQSTHPKIALFIPSLRGGGAERAMLLFAEGLVAEGRNPDLVVVQGGGALAAVVPKGVRLVNLNRRRTIAALLPLIRYLRRERPAALFSTVVHANIVALLAALLARVNVQVVVRESNVPLTEPKKTLSRRIVYRLIPLLYRQAAAVISVSEGVAAELRSYCPALASKIKVLPNPVVSPDFIRQSQEPLEHPWYHDGEIPVVLGAARMQPHKGFACLLEAFAQVRRQRSARLLILGDGPERPRLEALIKSLGLSDSVQLPGWVLNPFPYMRLSRVFVLSSEYEGMPNVLLQAMALGTAVVATDCPSGPREILEAGNLGELIPIGDPAVMAQAILRALDTPPPPAAAELVRERFGVQRAARAYLSVLHP